MAENTCSSSGSCSRESCEGCPSAAKAQQPQSMLAPANPKSHVHKVIGVVSGKGGVGKSMVTASLANQMAAQGYKVGILDADITGPSIPKMYGVHGPAEMDGDFIKPVMTANGIEVMSINLLLPDEESPVIWRGPILANMVKQFWSDVVWGELDFLFVDMPPGTGDVPLTVFQSIPVDGIIIVTSPQDLVSMIVAKAVNMAKLMNVPVLGMVENMSYFECPDCHKKHYIYGDSHLEETAKEYGINVTSRIPINPDFAQQCDSGLIELFEGDYLDNMSDRIEKLL